MLLAISDQCSVRWLFTLQQDGVAAHRARETAAATCKETPDFIGHPTLLT